MKKKFSRSSLSKSEKRRPWSNFWVIENRVVSQYTSLCVKVVIEPFSSDFNGGSSFSRHPYFHNCYTEKT